MARDKLKPNKDGYYRYNVYYEGKRYPVRSKSQRELWKKVAIKEEQLKSGQVVSNGNTTVDKWFDDFITTYKKPSITERTGKQLESYVKNYISPPIGRMRMKDVKDIDLQKILNGCKGMSTSQANKLRDLIKGAFRKARANKVILDNPAEYLEMPDTESGSRRAITNFERQHILKLCETHRAGLWIMIMLYAGLRPTECRELVWDNVDFDNAILAVKSAKNNYGVRKIPIPTPLIRKLSESKQTAKSEYVLVQARNATAHTKTSMRQMWESFKRALDIQMGAKTFKGGVIPETSIVAKDLTPYCLRHTYCTDLQTAGVPINVAKDLMGHTDISVTAKIYTHLSDKSFADAAAQIEALAVAEDNKQVIKFPV